MTLTGVPPIIIIIIIIMDAPVWVMTDLVLASRSTEFRRRTGGVYLGARGYAPNNIECDGSVVSRLLHGVPRQGAGYRR